MSGVSSTHKSIWSLPPVSAILRNSLAVHVTRERAEFNSHTTHYSYKGLSVSRALSADISKGTEIKKVNLIPRRVQNHLSRHPFSCAWIHILLPDSRINHQPAHPLTAYQHVPHHTCDNSRLLSCTDTTKEMFAKSKKMPHIKHLRTEFNTPFPRCVH